MSTIYTELQRYAGNGAVGMRLESTSARTTLPPRIKALYITTHHRSGAWLAEAFAADSASEVFLQESIGSVDGLARLRDEVFDVIFVSHVPGELDALDLVEGFRAGGSDEPMLVLGVPSEQEMAALAYEVGADAYVCIGSTTTRTLLWTAARAIERHQMVRENRRLQQAERQRLQQEHQEASRLLAQQRSLIHDLESLSHDYDGEDGSSTTEASLAQAVEPANPPVELPRQLVEHYREMLRAYVIMGSGNLSEEMSTLAELLASAGVAAQQAMLLHVQVLEELVRGLGSRSARHVMTRADLLILEVMINLADGYRERYFERQHPKQQKLLPGF